MKRFLLLGVTAFMFAFNANAGGAEDIVLFNSDNSSVQNIQFDPVENCATFDANGNGDPWSAQFNPPTWYAPSKGKSEAFEICFDAKYIGEGTDGDGKGNITFIQGRQFIFVPSDVLPTLCLNLGIEEQDAGWKIQNVVEQLYVEDFTDAPKDFAGGLLTRNVNFYPTDEWQHFSMKGTLGRHAADSVDLMFEFGRVAGTYSIKNFQFKARGNVFAEYFMDGNSQGDNQNQNENSSVNTNNDANTNNDTDDLDLFKAANSSVQNIQFDQDSNCVTFTVANYGDSWSAQFNPPTWIAPSKGKSEAFEICFDAKYVGAGTDEIPNIGNITFIQGRQFGGMTYDVLPTLCAALGIEEVDAAWKIQNVVEQLYVEEFDGMAKDFAGGLLTRNVNYYPTAEWAHYSMKGTLGRHAVDSVDLQVEFGRVAGTYSIKNFQFKVKGEVFAEYFMEESQSGNEQNNENQGGDDQNNENQGENENQGGNEQNNENQGAETNVGENNNNQNNESQSGDPNNGENNNENQNGNNNTEENNTENQDGETNNGNNNNNQNSENQGTEPNPQPLTPEEVVAQTINNIMGIIHAVITDDDEMAVNEVNIYAHHNTIVVENATDEIRVYDAMGRIVGRDVARNVCTIKINNSGVYIVKTGNTVKRVMVN